MTVNIVTMESQTQSLIHKVNTDNSKRKYFESSREEPRQIFSPGVGRPIDVRFSCLYLPIVNSSSAVSVLDM